MKTCPYYQANNKQVKAGYTEAGSQRYQCQHCRRRYTPQAKTAGYSDEMRHQAVKWYVDGMNFRRIARHLEVHHQTVINWINAHVSSLPAAPLPDAVSIIEQDELFTFIGEKKRNLRVDDS